MPSKIENISDIDALFKTHYESLKSDYKKGEIQYNPLFKHYDSLMPSELLEVYSKTEKKLEEYRKLGDKKFPSAEAQKIIRQNSMVKFIMDLNNISIPAKKA